MVSTRRSVQRAAEAGENKETSQAAGTSTTLKRGRTGARARGRPAAQVDEEPQLAPVQEAAAPAAQSQQVVEDVQEAQVNQQPETEPAAEPVAAGGEGPSVSKAEAIPGGGQDSESSGGEDDDSGSEESSDRSSSSDSDDDDILGPNLMGQLASSLRAALHARAGVRDVSPSPPAEQLLTSASEPKLGLGSEPEAIRWQAETDRVKAGSSSQKRLAAGTVAEKEKGLAKQLLAPPRSKVAEKESEADRKRWFELPTTKITDEVKQELRLLRLRGAYDPKRFYKSFDETKFPKRFQIGTVVDNPQDFYSSRLTGRERGASITQELLADPVVTAVRKKRYAKLQQEATRFQKVKKRKTDQVRANPKPKRPKH
ncbi:hypothetical protein Agub_g1278 [Astrephomene gubernaculifera]|uniref:Fcf2 pre-rRNA processing C-terminal domain-containing protein n=1 Tax=Astrephomene gubernaculifera TaxID=47775 RepID=A0AAD3HH63_9CHLO|nr:hypothetical protein Agub_g1278 [Astrephomene gubernaculifera]